MECRAIALTPFVTAREISSGRVLVFVPSDTTDAGHIQPASEIYLSKDEVLRLAAWVKGEDDDE